MLKILNGEINNIGLYFFAGELNRSIEYLAEILSDWIFRYTVIPYEVDLKDMLRKMLARAIINNNPNEVITELKTLKNAIISGSREQVFKISVSI